MAGTLNGIYRGVAVSSDDPSRLQRILVSVPVVTGTDSVWAFPCLPTPGALNPIVAPGTGVWVMFEGGDSAYPVWVGFYGTRQAR